MRRIHTILAMNLAMMATFNPVRPIDQQNHIANAGKPLGTSPFFSPTKSQIVKNKINRKRYA